jgi:hypothetical protein
VFVCAVQIIIKGVVKVPCCTCLILSFKILCQMTEGFQGVNKALHGKLK